MAVDAMPVPTSEEYCMTDFLQGIDVSHYDGNINWTAVAGDRCAPQFAYLKATEGGTMVDSQYSANRVGAMVAGLLQGAYHFFVPGVPVADQVANFCKTVGSVQGQLPPILDIERGGLSQPDYAAAVLQWLQQTGEKLGCTPGIYTTASFWESNLGSFAPFLAYPLWIAEYTSQPSPHVPQGASYTFWQYSSTGVVRGISSSVDMNRYAGSPAQLQALLCA